MNSSGTHGMPVSLPHRLVAGHASPPASARPRAVGRRAARRRSRRTARHVAGCGCRPGRAVRRARRASRRCRSRRGRRERTPTGWRARRPDRRATDRRARAFRLRACATAVRAAGESVCPANEWFSDDENCDEMTAPTAAMAISPAIRAIALLTPDAIPALDSSASERTAAVNGATVHARPKEKTSRAGSRSVR